jgi:alpha/beta superfamily hydrolase
VDLFPVTTADGETLAAQRAPATGPERARVLLCHPHPQHGGSMQSLVISELFRQLPGHGLTCLRFDFRGVGRSTGSFGHGVAERLDVQAALDALVRDSPAGAPVLVVGWSFGADLALSCLDPRVTGWVGIALPMHWLADADAVGADLRPKLLLLAEHDEFRAPDEVLDATSDWTATTTEVLPGASHFFVGRTDSLVCATVAWTDALVG